MRDLEMCLGELERGSSRAETKHRVSYRMLQRLAGLARLGKGLPTQVERSPWLTLMFAVMYRDLDHQSRHI